MTIIRTKTRAEGGLTADEKLRMAEVSAFWTKNALRTDPADPAKLVPAIKALYAAADLPEPKVIVVPSPKVMAIAGVLSACVLQFRKKGIVDGAATSAATDVATNAATNAATSAATDVATRAATDVATSAATSAATDDVTSAATDDVTSAATRAATDVATDVATRDATYVATYVATDDVTSAATDVATNAATRAATRAATSAATFAATYNATDVATSTATSDATDVATDDATRAATRDATDVATDDATRAATDVATRVATSTATFAATYAATNDATSTATYDATDDVTSAATRDATSAATRAATFAATYDATSAATGVATDVATSTATSDATHDATNDATNDATSTATYDATRAATRAATDVATRVATSTATFAATNDATRSATRSATEVDVSTSAEQARQPKNWVLELIEDFVGPQYADAVVQVLPQWRNMYQGGNMWSGWCGYLSAARDVLGLELAAHAKYKSYEDCAIEGGFRFMHADFCMVSDRPEILKMDNENRSHCEDGPSHKWRDGWSLYHWHGVAIPAEWIEDKPRLTAKIALTWENIEQRRAACEIVGWAKILKELHAVVIDKDDDPQIGTLLEVDLPDSGTERFIYVQCGTGREFALPVPKDCGDTALAANAWTYGLDKMDYMPEVRT